FYYTNEAEDWNCSNIVEYYRVKSKQKERKKILDYIKKDIQKVDDLVFEFDETRRRKAREILDNWK
ncbi:6271_t:CDS:1, partial [Racocetra fulgida]